MATRLRRTLKDLIKARLSRRIVGWVFLSIVVIEAIILIPSVYRREQELLNYLKELSTARGEGILAAGGIADTEPELLAQFEQMLADPVVKGIALYRADGSLVGSIEEAPDLSIDEINRGQTKRFTRATNRYDAVWKMSPLEERFTGRYIPIIRHDSTWVRQEIILFIFRIAGLVLIISVFVTSAALIVLERLIIGPVLRLRTDLLTAGQAITDDCDPASLQFESTQQSLQSQRKDELGDVVAAFEKMFYQIVDAITMRKQAEASLRLSEEKFSKAFQASPNPITLSTLTDGHIIEANASFLAFHGSELPQVIDKTALDIGLWADTRNGSQGPISDHRAAMIHRIKTEGFVRNQEYQFQRRTGEIRTVLYSAEQIEIGGKTCVLAVVNDITERKQAEEALRESETRFKTLIEQAADAFYVINVHGQILDVNQQACRSLGYTRDELVRLRVPDIQKKLGSEDFQNLWRRLVPGKPLTIEGIHQRKDGSTFPVEVGVGLLEFSGERYLLALARDATARKQAESALARLAEIGELAAMIVHEVRNPLTTILMGLNSFKRMDLPERAKMRLTFALEESERLQRLLNEILLYARQQQLDANLLNLCELAEEMLPALRSMPAAASRVIEVVADQSAIPIKGDKDKLKQVFINLVSNACEAAPAGETITWRLAQSNGQVNVEVHNGGEPIPPDVLPKLTQPFFTTKASGNGLGLAITRRIIEAHNGELTIQSSVDLGTTVSITLPSSLTIENNSES
ncbi:MAG: PAS domain S-box protein [Cyanobacteria bacterium J06635_15]